MGNNISSPSPSTETVVIRPTLKLSRSHSSYGDGHKFCQVSRILYTYGASSCCIEIHEIGASNKRTHTVETRVTDKDENSHNLVDASVTVTKHRSGITVRSCNVKPGEGVIENWCHSSYWVQAVRYFSAQRYGLFAFIRLRHTTDDEVISTVQHYYASRSNNDGGFVVDVKIKYDGISGGYVVEVEGPRKMDCYGTSSGHLDRALFLAPLQRLLTDIVDQGHLTF
ncbi:uncharacterized protein G2W53_005845 [Senna tora]|uniref:Uncharacterized protein n=1 Tax=Senna tora TaxID=362788 RepID=A0A834X347_9FABA|nr:uncharacterized protein G2W53_005845 [Senna tora]